LDVPAFECDLIYSSITKLLFFVVLVIADVNNYIKFGNNLKIIPRPFGKLLMCLAHELRSAT